MADISKQIEDFRNAIYGEDVRGSMIEAFNAINDSTEGLADEAKASEHAAKASEENAKLSEQTAASTLAAIEQKAQEALESAAEAGNKADIAVQAQEAASESATEAGAAMSSACRARDDVNSRKAEIEEIYQSIRNTEAGSEYEGCTEDTAGVAGMVPPASKGNVNRVFSADGKWKHTLEVDIVMQNDQYGYIGERGMFIPFKNQDDIDAAISSAMVGTATAADVLSGKTFTNKNTSGLEGSMVNQGKKTYTINPGAQQTIPKGYHDGTGFVKANPNQNNDRYVFPSGDNGAEKDLGANNTYRYVDATNVYRKGQASPAVEGTISFWRTTDDFNGAEELHYEGITGSKKSGLYQVNIRDVF